MRRSPVVPVLLLVIAVLAAAVVYLLAQRGAASPPAAAGASPATQPAGGLSGFYYINGHVARGGAYSFAGRPITLRQAIAAAGGLERDREEAGIVTVSRQGPTQG